MFPTMFVFRKTQLNVQLSHLNSSHEQVNVCSRYVAEITSVSEVVCRLLLILLPFGGSFTSVLPSSRGIVVRAVESDVDDGNQAPGGAQRA